MKITKLGPYYQFECDDCYDEISDCYTSQRQRDQAVNRHKKWHQENPPCPECGHQTPRYGLA